MSRKIYIDFDFFDYIFFNRFDFTIPHINLIRYWVNSCIHIISLFSGRFLTLCLHRLYECLIEYCELPIYKKMTARDIRIMKFGLSQDLYEHLFNRTRYYVEFRRIFYSNTHYITRYIYNTSYYNKLFFEYMKRDYALSNWYYGRRISINNRYINYICLEQVCYNILKSYNFYLRKYLNIMIITLYRYILRYDVYIRVHMFCFVKDLRGQNRRFRELREMYYYNNKRWKLHNHLVAVFININFNKKIFRNKFKLFNKFRFCAYYSGGISSNTVSLEDKFFSSMIKFKYKLIFTMTYFNMFLRSYENQIIGAFMYEYYKDLGLRFMYSRSILFAKGGFSVIPWFYNIFIQYYFWKHTVLDNYIYVRYNLYSTMFYLKCIHFISYLLVNTLYNNICSDYFYIYFNLNANLDFKNSILEYESMVSYKYVAPLPNFIKCPQTSGIIDINTIKPITLMDFLIEPIGQSIEGFLTIYTNIVEPFKSKGQCFRLLFTKVDPVILASNEIYGSFRRENECYKLFLNIGDQLFLSDMVQPFVSKIGYYKLLLSGITYAVSGSIVIMESIISKGERYNLLRKRSRSLKLIFYDGIEPLTLLDLMQPSIREYLKLFRKPVTHKVKFSKIKAKKRKHALLVVNNLLKSVILVPLVVNYGLWKNYILWNGLGKRTLWGRYGRIRWERRIQKHHLWFINRIYRSNLVIFIYFILFGLYDWFSLYHINKLYITGYESNVLYNDYRYNSIRVNLFKKKKINRI